MEYGPTYGCVQKAEDKCIVFSVAEGETIVLYNSVNNSASWLSHIFNKFASDRMGQVHLPLHIWKQKAGMLWEASGAVEYFISFVLLRLINLKCELEGLREGVELMTLFWRAFQLKNTAKVRAR